MRAVELYSREDQVGVAYTSPSQVGHDHQVLALTMPPGLPLKDDEMVFVLVAVVILGAIAALFAGTVLAEGIRWLFSRLF